MFLWFLLSICLAFFLRAWRKAELWSFFFSSLICLFVCLFCFVLFCLFVLVIIASALICCDCYVMLCDCTHSVIYSEYSDLVKSWAVAKFFPIYRFFTRFCILLSHAAIFYTYLSASGGGVHLDPLFHFARLLFKTVKIFLPLFVIA